MLRRACVLGLALPAAAQNFAIAQIKGAQIATDATEPKWTGGYRSVTGYVKFEQAADDPLGDVKVTYEISGLTEGKTYGFHVHQYGDTRITYNLASMAAHFVPTCVLPDIGEDGNAMSPVTEAACGAATTRSCECDQRHGLPPSSIRQPGDMGNLESTGGVTSGSITLGQEKMSLTDALRSVVGRVVVIHSNEDDGTQPYGNAGAPMAYGVIALGPADAADNAALAPTVPKVDKIVCTFEAPRGGETGTVVYGDALLTLQEPCDSGGCKARMQAKLFGLKKGEEHSFHFHKWGDMTVNYKVAGALGDIYKSHGVNVDSLAVQADDSAQYDVMFDTDTLLEHVGRSLTVHEGSGSDTPTIAAAACGLANPTSKLETPAAPKPTGGMKVSGGVAALTVISALLFATMAVVGVLYYFRKPIPLCGRCIYADDFIKEVRPPQPSAAPPSSPPPQGV
jgi:Cu/Zn superoxide dismutase